MGYEPDAALLRPDRYATIIPQAHSRDTWASDGIEPPTLSVKFRQGHFTALLVVSESPESLVLEIGFTLFGDVAGSTCFLPPYYPPTGGINRVSEASSAQRGALDMSVQKTISMDREIVGLKPANKRYEVAISARGVFRSE
jgi:hypothetical protein